MGQRSDWSATYNKGVWKRRDARYHDQKAKNGLGSAEIYAYRFGAKCSPTCGCGRSHKDASPAWKERFRQATQAQSTGTRHG